MPAVYEKEISYKLLDGVGVFHKLFTSTDVG